MSLIISGAAGQTNHLRDDSLLRAEYLALTQRAGVLVLPDPGILRVDGRDRTKWLHNLVTANILTMAENSAKYSLLLDAKAHVVADFVLVRQSEYFLLYTSRASHENLYSNLRRAIFRDQVTLTDISERFGIISILGPQSVECVKQSLNTTHSILQFPPDSHAALGFQDFLLISNPRISNRFDMLAPRANIPDLDGTLATNGADPISLDAVNIVHVEGGIPQFGTDFDETTLPPEALLDEFIASDKGCYPGQETIARIRNLGHVNRLLVRLQITSNELPDRGDLIVAAEKGIGEITNAVWSFSLNAPLALGYVRREYATDGMCVQVAHGNVLLMAIVKV